MSTFFVIWNIFGSILLIPIFMFIINRRAKQEKRRREKIEEREKKELQELLSGLSINEDQVVRDLVRHSSHSRLVYENF